MTINCNGKLVDLSTPKVMGILNITPDSFFDGGTLKSDADMLNRIETLLSEGTTFIDVGGYSSRPNAKNVSEAEEVKRVVPVIEAILKRFPEALISVDTFRSEVAEQALKSGACIINDISAGKLDNNMLKIVAKFSAPYIMMHMKGTPQTMAQHTQYDNLVKDILFYFSERIAEAVKLGIKDIIIDIGFGFAKTVEQNFQLMSQLDLFNMVERPMLVGISRKSMIYKTLGTSPEEALNATTALNTIALQKGAKILRVHDVKEAMECVKLVEMLGN